MCQRKYLLVYRRYHWVMRWMTTSTWIRIAALFGIYLLVLAAWFGISRASDSMEIVKSLVFLILLVILPLLAIVFGAWDGVKEGFSLLWLLAPFACFLAPMFLFLNDSALIYGVGYSILGFVAHGVGALIHARRARGRG